MKAMKYAAMAIVVLLFLYVFSFGPAVRYCEISKSAESYKRLFAVYRPIIALSQKNHIASVFFVFYAGHWCSEKYGWDLRFLEMRPPGTSSPHKAITGI
jgi:hypothetical protein